MGAVRKKTEKEARISIQSIILATVATAGVLAIGMAAPNVFQVLKMFRNFDDSKRRAQYRYSVNVAIRRLQEKKLLYLETHGGKSFYRLTERGVLELARYRTKEKAIGKRRWDGKWRMVIFDIKESRRTMRDRLRRTLHEFGFVRLQHSVWVSPFECEEVVQLLKAECHIGKDALYITAERIENDGSLRRKFKLAK